MKKWIALLALLVSFNSYSQFNQDSLSKYCYSIFGYTPPSHSFFGSGFFIRRNNSLYFVSAKHVVTGCIYGAYLKHFPKEMNIVIDSPKTLINARVELIAKRDPCSVSFKDSDFVVTKVSSRFMKYVHSVEAFILPPFDSLQEADIYGFPHYRELKRRKMDIFEPPYKMNLPHQISSLFVNESSEKIDLTSCFFEVGSFMSDYDSLGGFSGAPIFVKDAFSPRVRILGIFTGSSVDQGGKIGIWFVPIEFALKAIDESVRYISPSILEP